MKRVIPLLTFVILLVGCDFVKVGGSPADFYYQWANLIDALLIFLLFAYVVWSGTSHIRKKNEEMHGPTLALTFIISIGFTIATITSDFFDALPEDLGLYLPFLAIGWILWHIIISMFSIEKAINKVLAFIISYILVFGGFFIFQEFFY